MDLPRLTLPLVATLGLCIVGLLLFLWNRWRFEVVGLIILAALFLLGILPLEDALSGFSSDATLAVAGVLILSSGLERTGVVDMLARAITRLGGSSELRLLLALMVITIPIGAFLNNTAVVAVLLPAVFGAARQHDIAPSRLLIPLSYSSQLGGSMTLIGSSTNLLVSGVLIELGQPGFSFFQMTAPGAVLALAGVVYLVTVGRRQLPIRKSTEDELERPFREFQSALLVEDSSPFIGATFQQVRMAGFSDLDLEQIRRPFHEGELGADTALHAGDLLLVEGPSDTLKHVDDIAGLRMAMRPRATEEMHPDALVVMEAVISPRSRLVGSELRSIGPQDSYGIAFLALQRHGRHPELPTTERPLRPGDLVLVEGTRAGLNRAQQTGLLLPVMQVMPPLPHRKRWLSSGILLAVVLLAAFGVIPMVVAVLLGVIAMVVSGCIDLGETYERVDWGVVILLGSIIPLGLAMQQTGAAQLLAGLVLGATQDYGPHVVLMALYLSCSVFTEFVSNNAAAAVFTPVAVAVAIAIDASPIPFAMAVMFAASNSFLTPIGYQTNTMVYGPGGYRFSDFARIGAPLTLILVLLATLVLPLFFPF